MRITDKLVAKLFYYSNPVTSCAKTTVIEHPHGCISITFVYMFIAYLAHKRNYNKLCKKIGVHRTNHKQEYICIGNPVGRLACLKINVFFFFRQSDSHHSGFTR